MTTIEIPKELYKGAGVAVSLLAEDANTMEYSVLDIEMCAEASEAGVKAAAAIIEARMPATEPEDKNYISWNGVASNGMFSFKLSRREWKDVLEQNRK